MMFLMQCQVCPNFYLCSLHYAICQIINIGSIFGYFFQFESDFDFGFMQRASSKTRPEPSCNILVKHGVVGKPTFPGRYVVQEPMYVVVVMVIIFDILVVKIREKFSNTRLAKHFTFLSTIFY